MTYAWLRADGTASSLADGRAFEPVADSTALPVAPAADALVFAVVSDRAGFDALEPEWDDLFGRAGRDTQLFQTFAWAWHWANHYLEPRAGARCSLAIVTGRRAGRLVALWPLVLERVAGFKVLRWLGEPVSQYGDALVEAGPDEQMLLRQAWEFIAGGLGADAVVLRKVRADAAVAPALRGLGLRPTAVAGAPCLDLATAADFAAYEQRYSAKARKNRRRLMRRLQERGPVAVVRHAGGSAARAATLASIALKRTALAAAGEVSPALADPRFAAFFADVAEGSRMPAGCSVTLLTCNGEAAAAAVDISVGARRATHILVHDPAFDDCGVGALLMEERIRIACAEGVAVFDLLAPAHPYKMDWADRTVAVEDFALGLTPAGRVYADIYLRRLRGRLKRAAEALARSLGRLRPRPAR